MPDPRARRAGSASPVLLACLCVGWVAAVLGCAGTIETRMLEARYPVLAKHPGHRLADIAPYFAPYRASPGSGAAHGEPGLALFLCRFASDAPVAVALPEDATAAERVLLTRALGAWQDAGLGVSFRVAPREELRSAPRIEIDFVDASTPHGPAPAADTIADCAVPETVEEPLADGSTRAAPVAAELTFASIHLRRTRPDALERLVPLTEAELLGAVVHELGHALGYPGHVRAGDAVMAAHGQVDAARRWGRRMAEGRRLESPTLAALYALPAGARVGALPLTSAQLAPVHALNAAARAAGLVGPFVRVGDRDARLFWRGARGSVVLGIDDWKHVIREPSRFSTRFNVRARRLLQNASGGPEPK